MGRLSKNHRKFMTKEQMVTSIVKLYSLYKDGSLPLANVYIIIDHILWSWTEFDGKYKGCKWWSRAAYDYFLSTNKTNGLIHEHVVPRKIMRDEIVKILNKGCTEENMYVFLEKHLIGCVILREEDNRLDKTQLGCELNDDATWNRYNLANIDRIKVKW